MSDSRKIFLSYRRMDKERSDLVHRIRERLETEFPGEIFFDSTEMKPGDPLSSTIESAIANCHVFLPVFDSMWGKIFQDRRSKQEIDHPWEELCLAVTRHADQDDPILFIPIFLNEAAIRPIKRVIKSSVDETLGKQLHKVLDHLGVTIRSGDDFENGICKLIDSVATKLGIDGRSAPKNWTDQLAGNFTWRQHLQTKLRETFVGRDWLFREIQFEADYATPKHILILAGPGTGKSAVVARLARSLSPSDRDEAPGSQVGEMFGNIHVAAVHFCVEGNDADTLDPLRFCRSLAHQLANACPELATCLNESAQLKKMLDRPVEPVKPPEVIDAIFSAIGIENPFSDRKPRWLAIDSLDEGATYGGGGAEDTIPNLVLEKYDALPPWLRLFLTSRPDHEVFQKIDPSRDEGKFKTINLEDDRSRKDVESYVQTWLPKRLAALGDSVNEGQITAQLLERSNHNFLYLSLLKRHLDSNASMDDARVSNVGMTLNDVLNPPDGLWAVYNTGLRRVYAEPGGGKGGGKRTFHNAKKILATIVAAHAVVNDEMLKAVGLRQCSLDQDWKRLRPFLREPTGNDRTWVKCHQSLEDFLLGNLVEGMGKITGKTSGFSFPDAFGHGLLATACLRPDCWNPKYAYEHCVSHCLCAGRHFDALRYLVEQRSCMEENERVGPMGFQRQTKLFCAGLVEPSKLLEELQKMQEDERGSLLRRFAGTLQFYEIEALLRPVKLLTDAKLFAHWPDVFKTLLSLDDFTLQYAIGQALADQMQNATQPEHKQQCRDYVESLLKPGLPLDKWEVGAYASKFHAMKSPRVLESEIKHLAGELFNCGHYIGPMVLGELLLDRACRPSTDLKRLRPIVPESFWTPIWDYLQLDVAALDALQVLHEVKGGADAESPLVSAELAAWRFLIERLQRLEQHKEFKTRTPELHGLFRSVNQEVGPWHPAAWKEFVGLSINKATLREGNLQRSLHLLDDDLLQLTVEALFAHPQWDVGEATATVLSSLVGNSRKGPGLDPIGQRVKRLIPKLLNSENRRVRYAAVETAFGARHFDNGRLFREAVEKRFNDPDCRVRGLCAENLTDCVLSREIGDDMVPRNLLERFLAPLQFWFQKDRSCWLLDQLFWLTSGLATARDAKDNQALFADAWDFLEAEVLALKLSPMFEESPDGRTKEVWRANWFRDRKEFLVGIELIQRRLVAEGRGQQEPEVAALKLEG